MTTLTDLIPLLEAMPFDDLRDWIDYVEFYHLSKWISDFDERKQYQNQVRNRRTGLASGGLPYGMFPPANPLQMSSDLQHEAEDMLIELNEADQQVAVTMAQALHRLKSPIRRTSSGNIQVKKIPYEYILRDPETRKPVLDDKGKVIMVQVVGLYLYLRYWQVQGDKDRSKSRVKSIYIGGAASGNERVSEDFQYPYRKLANHFADLLQEHGVERQRTIKRTGEIQTYRVRPTGDDNPIAQLEKQVLACIDMARVDEVGADAIDYACLDSIQQGLPE